MKRNTKTIVVAAVIAALYTALCYAQNLIFPDSATFVIQFRAAEALMILSFFTPAAIPGMSLGCLLFNLSYAGALPLDFLVGTTATALACWGMYLTRNVTVKSYPLAGMLLPGLTNGLLVGWELTYYIGNSFWFNMVCVAVGELAVMFTLGTVLYYAMGKRGLDRKLFR